MKIAVLTSGILPVPAVQGGAVENLVDYYLEYNEQHRLHDITIFSVWHPDVVKHPAQKSEVNHYRYIKTGSWWNKLKKKLYQKVCNQTYYHYTIDFFLYEVIRHLRHQHYDAIILENRPGFALQLKEVTDAKLIYHLHNDHLNSAVPQAVRLYNDADRIITVSDFLKKRVMTINHQDTKTQTVPNGINLKVFTNSSNESRTPHDDFILVFCGRLIPEKGILQLILAMRQLKNYADIKLVIIGSGSLGSIEQPTAFQHQLQEAAQGLDNIRFTGYIDYCEIAHYLKDADVAVLPSTWQEPFGLTMAEALAAGLPIITSSQGGIPEVVTNESAIQIDIDEHFIDNLAAAILDLYQHPEKRRAMAEASVKRSKLFDKETYAKNFFAAIE